MSRRRLVLLSGAVAALLLLLWIVVRVASRPEASPEAPPETAATPSEATAVEQEPGEAPAQEMHSLDVLVYYPSAKGDGLNGETREIFLTTAPGDRAKQILAELISGPGPSGALRALPPGTELRQVYVLDDGTAWVDFSGDLRAGLGGGSTGELFAVYAIVNSVALNIPEIKRVGILIDGEPIETLNGHLDLRRALPPDRTLIVAGSAPA